MIKTISFGADAPNAFNAAELVRLVRIDLSAIGTDTAHCDGRRLQNDAAIQKRKRNYGVYFVRLC